MPLVVKSEYKYIEKIDGVPFVKGTKLPVKALVIHYKAGMSIEDILDGFPNITPAQLFDTLAYYHDHKNEIEEDIEEDSLEYIEKEFNLKLAPDRTLKPK
ncbi:MAG: DUF433 domain-containing protein [bacterium]|nr:DUF433 domain-containing protein [bacterium]